MRLIFGFRRFSQGDIVHLRNEILMREQSWLSGELLQQAKLASAGLVVVQLHLVCQTAGLSARLKIFQLYISLAGKERSPI